MINNNAFKIQQQQNDLIGSKMYNTWFYSESKLLRELFLDIHDVIFKHFRNA